MLVGKNAVQKKKGSLLNLNARQKKIFVELEKQMTAAEMIAPTDSLLLEIAAATIVEVAQLQTDVSKNGYTYKVIGRSGDIYSKHRPEHQMLVEARKRLQSILNDLGMTPKARKLVEKAMGDGSDLQTLLNLKTD
jgi:P27 family predicted phage terminase small subunit